MYRGGALVDRCPHCGKLIAQRTVEQNAAFHALCAEIAKQRDWPRGTGGLLGPSAWKRMLMAAFDRAHGRAAELLPAIDGDGFDQVHRKSSRLSKQEMSELLEYATAWAVFEGVVLRERSNAA